MFLTQILEKRAGFKYIYSKNTHIQRLSEADRDREEREAAIDLTAS